MNLAPEQFRKLKKLFFQFLRWVYLKTAKLQLRAILPRLGLIFGLTGVISLVIAVVVSSQVLAFIGLGLTFWGALFFFITPTKYVEGSLLWSTAITYYQTIDRILNDRKYASFGYHIPPFPQNAYLPDHLRGLKEMTVFVPLRTDDQTPAIDSLAEGKFRVKKPEGFLITPPGLGLLAKIEKDFSIDFTKTSINDLCELMPKFILDNLNLAKTMELEVGESQVGIKLYDSIYKALYQKDVNFISINFLGCPIISSVACAIAKATGKSVSIQDLQASGAQISGLFIINKG